MINQRELALDILTKTISDEAYANLLMRKELNKLPPINRPFVTELVYGSLRNYYLLEYQFLNDIRTNTKLRLKNILILGLYERFYLNNKDYAIVNEYVELCDNKFDKAFVNSILRNKLILNKANEEYINYSLPSWIYNLIDNQYSSDEKEKILNIYASKAKTYYRLNKNKASYSDLKDLKIKPIDDLFFTSSIPLASTPEFKKGYFYMQDYNSRKIVDYLDLNENENLLDMCSAPGSKLFNCLEHIKPVNAYANDLYKHRVELIKKAAERLGYSNINYLNYDATKMNLNKNFNKILLDAPCSGLGVIGRKPDLKFHIKSESLDELQLLQKDLLENAYNHLANNGILVYSTCTINKKENTKQINSFLNRHEDLSLMKEETIFDIGGDLFYLAKIKKV